MSSPEAANGYAFFDLQPASSDMLDEVLEGLQSVPKFVAPKYFYDERGSKLFEAITKLPEYYLTKTEMQLFDQHLDEVHDLVGEGGCLVEYGSGSSLKIRKLLECLHPDAYLPVDISRDHLERNASELHKDYPWLHVYPTCADFTEPFELPPLVAEHDKIGFFPGSSIGNFEPSGAARFLSNVAHTLGAGGHLLVGVDRKKDVDVLEAAYNDSAGITARFNLNLLQHLNDVLDAGFELERFRHRASYNESLGCIQMFLESQTTQTIELGEATIAFGQGEAIHTENSYKYDVDQFVEIAAAGGFAVHGCWTDPREYFSLFLLAVEP